MAVRWEVHIPQAMQRHTGSVKDAAPKPSNVNDTAIPLVPEYGDPIWLPPAQPDQAEYEDELRQLG